MSARKQVKFRVHRLVAMAFHQPVKGRDCVNHKNGKRDDNRATNLEWINKRDNAIHSIKRRKKQAKKDAKARSASFDEDESDDSSLRSGD